MKKRKSSLRSRWLGNTLTVFCLLGLVCVLLITATFAVYYYSNMRSDMMSRAAQTSQFFSGYISQNYDDYYQSCVSYAQTFEMSGSMELQFINNDGVLVASSYGPWAGKSPRTGEIAKAIRQRQTEPFIGVDPDTGEHIMAVSCPMIYSDGQVVGVLRYVTSTRLLNRQILQIALVAVGAFFVLLSVLLLSSGYYIRSIVLPVNEITQKARRIANGSYGAQIQKKYNDEIGVLADTINEMSAKINQNEKMQAEFIASLSHELRTPLTAINGWSETLLSDDSLDEQTSRGVKIISREARRLTDMVMELLDFTRLQDGRFTLNVQVSDIRAAFEDTVYMYGSHLQQNGIRLDYMDTDEEIPEIPCDCARLRQVFLNILDNAAKHGGEGKRIEASMTVEEENVVVRIRDYGPGIPEEELPLVKKKFYKGNTKVRGTGIGLAVCDEIVQMHGGVLDIANAPGGGTVVTVSLPVAQ
ncbi:MAG: HAMP domain-containing protein [Ruminococcaceae bacterium]|nr:HAMP domain-containing protein [Oscillospiraceae bacterium]